MAIDKRKDGFSLAESVIAMLLFGLMIVYFMSAFVIGRYVTRLTKERIAVSRILSGYVEVISAVGNYESIVVSPPQEQLSINDGLRTFTATKSSGAVIEDSSIYGYKKVWIKIEWYGGLSASQRLFEEAVTYVTKQ